MAGGLYIYIMGGLCVGVTLLIAGMALLFWLGHRMEKKETGSTHGFLELPDELKSRPAATDVKRGVTGLAASEGNTTDAESHPQP